MIPVIAFVIIVALFLLFSGGRMDGDRWMWNPTVIFPGNGIFPGWAIFGKK
jgi:hypothetical protein